jgi:hypothetical protein
MRIPALSVLLLLLPGAVAQDTRPASRPAPIDSEETLRLLAASVMPPRIVARAKEICAFGPRPPASVAASGSLAWMKEQLAQSGLHAAVAGTEVPGATARREWLTASLGKESGSAPVVISSRLSNDSGSPGAHETAAGASCLLESARVLQAFLSKKLIAELPFEIRLEIDHARDASAASRPAAVPAMEIRFGELGLGVARHCLFVTVSAAPDKSAALVAQLGAILAKWKGERGFWQEFEIVADGAPLRSDGAPRVTLSCTSAAGAVTMGTAAESRSTGDSCPLSGTDGDTAVRTVGVEPYNAVNATRFALFLIARHAADQGPR